MYIPVMLISGSKKVHRADVTTELIKLMPSYGLLSQSEQQDILDELESFFSTRFPTRQDMLRG